MLHSQENCLRLHSFKTGLEEGGETSFIIILSSQVPWLKTCKYEVVSSFSSHKLWASLLVSWHITSLHILLHRNSNLSLFHPLNNTIWCTQSCPVSSFSCLPLQYSHRRLCGHRGDSGDHICASCSKKSVPKTQLRMHLNWSEMQVVR